MDNAQVTQKSSRASRYLSDQKAAQENLATYPESTRQRLRAWQTKQSEWFDNVILEIVSEFIAVDDALRAERSEPVGWMYERRQTGEGVTAEFFSRRRWVLHSEAYTETPLYTTPPEPVAEIERLREAGQFLLDRLVDHEVRMTSDEDGREWFGHVTPAMARFRAALGDAFSSSEGA